jgi:TolB-like protein/Tfp pilus assembly protein PilF
MAQKSDIPVSFWRELKRRRVIHMITVYAAVAFVILQVADIVAQPLRLPDWTEAFVIVLLSIGFVIAVFLSWVYDVTPTGVKKTKPENSLRHANQINQVTPGGWKIATIISAFVIIALTAFNFINKGKSEDLSKLEKSIAVLPFRNDSPNDTNTYFINGIMEEVLNHLQLVKDLRVISRTSVEQYRNTTKSIPEIAKEQGVNFIVEGSGQKYGNSFRISVQLIRAAKENHLWGKSYDQKIREPGDIINVQSKIAQSIVSELDATISPEVKLQIEKVHTANLTAYDFYQRGRNELPEFWIEVDDFGALERAGKFYRKALEFDPEFADAYVGLAELFYVKHLWSDYSTDKDLDSVLYMTNLALSYDDQLPEAYFVKGNYYVSLGQNDNALKEFDKALNLNPNDWMAYYGKAKLYQFNDPIMCINNLQEAVMINHHGQESPTIFRMIGGELLVTGFIDKAKPFFLKAFEMDEDSAFLLSCLGGIESDQGNYRKSVEYFRRASLNKAKYAEVIGRLVDDYTTNGQFKEALEFYKELATLTDYKDPLVGYTYWQNGLKEEAYQVFDQLMASYENYLKTNRPNDQTSWIYFDRARIYSFRRDKDNAFKYLKLFSQTRDCELWMLTHVKNDPLFNNIRSEPEFRQIVSEMESNYHSVHERMGKWLEGQQML